MRVFRKRSLRLLACLTFAAHVANEKTNVVFFVEKDPGWGECDGTGGTCDNPVVGMGFYQKLLEVAGLPSKPVEHVDRVSLTSLLSGRAEALPREALYGHCQRTQPQDASWCATSIGRKPMMRATEPSTGIDLTTDCGARSARGAFDGPLKHACGFSDMERGHT